MDSDGCPEDDSDADTVPDQIDACEDQAETLNGVKDADGCPDGVALIERRGQALTTLGELSFDADHLSNEKALVATLADFIKRNHKRGSVRVVLYAPDTVTAPARAAALAKALEKGIKQPVDGVHKSGAPQRFEVELLSPGQSDAAAKPAAAKSAPAAAKPAATTGKAAAPATPVAPQTIAPAPKPAPAATPSPAPKGNPPAVPAPR
jgi:hypothetical protein